MKLSFRILIVLLIFTTFVPVTTNAHEGHIYTGGFSNASNLTYQIENNKYTSGYFINAAREWSKQSTQVSMIEARQNVPANLYFRDGVNGPSGTYGLAVPYYRTSSGDFEIDWDAIKTWDHVVVYMYMNNMSGFVYENYTFVALHEVGHALSMDHNNVIGVSTVMRDNLGVLKHTTPTSSDRDHLQLKWGK